MEDYKEILLLLLYNHCRAKSALVQSVKFCSNLKLSLVN